MLIIGAVIVACVPVGLVASGRSASGAAPRDSSRDGTPRSSSGSWATLLALSNDLGPSKVSSIDVLLALRSTDRPVVLANWAKVHRLAVTWYQGEQFAVLSGSAASVTSALGVPVDNYVSRTGEHFYASNRQPAVPGILRAEVTGIGRISNYGRLEKTFMPSDYVPNGGLTPAGLLQAYQATSLSDRGFQGQGETVVFLEVTPVEQSDLDAFTQKFGLPPIKLQTVGGNASGGPSQSGEADMDIETVHEIAPQARLVYFDANDPPGLTNTSDFGAQMALSIAAVSREFPAAVVSMSLGQCERSENSVDLQDTNNAVAMAEATGSTLYASAGDVGGAECGDFGADSLTSAKGVLLPADAPDMTGVGGTTLTVATNGVYVGETTWSSVMMSQGSGGGVSVIAARPPWQVGPGVGEQGVPDMREVPDVSAEADPETGTAFVTQGKFETGGGTSLAAPIWAGFTALIDEFLHASGEPPIGFANPLFYKLARTQLSPPPFHDVTVGGDDFYRAGTGYDPVTGLGTPDVAALAQYILNMDKSAK